MKASMPPLRALIAFEAAVRHASFKLAAEELNISPGAVSQQVRKLEDWLGYPLFLREIRQLTATERALDFYGRIAPPLEQIREESNACRMRRSGTVCLSLPPALAAKWLAPRMADFIAAHPAIDLSINSVSYPIDFSREPVDLAIRYFDGQDPALEAQRLYTDDIRVFCSPAYREQLKLRRPNDLTNAVLLHIKHYGAWDDWLSRFSSLNAATRNSIRTLHFDQSLLGLEAAKRGQGVVLSNRLLAQDELDRGELIDLFGLAFEQPKGYYLVHPRLQPLSPEVSILKQWLVEQFAETARDG